MRQMVAPVAHEVQALCVGWYLDYIRRLKRNLEHYQNAIEEKDALLNAMSVSYDKTGSAPSRNLDRMADGVMELISLREALEEECREHLRIYEHARETCMVTEGGLIVWKNRVDRKSYNDIAKEHNVSLRTCKRLAYQGTEDIYQVMPEKYRDAIPKAL